MHLPSASSLTRAFACSDSELIGPRIDHAPTQYSSHGDSKHAFLQAVLSGTPPAEALAAVPAEDRQACADLDLEAMPTGGELELALAWDPDTGRGRVLGRNIGREYEAAGADRTREYVGSFDFAGKHALGHGVLVDWKSGWQTIRARDSWQLLGGAVFLADTFGLADVVASHLYVREGQDPKWDTVEFDALALDRARALLRELAAKLRAEAAREVRTVAVREGEHCRYCPAFRACPAKVSTLQAMVRAVAAVQPGTAPDLSGLPAVIEPHDAQALQARARDAVLLLERYDAAAKLAWADLAAYAEEYPIDLGDGRVMRMAPGQARDKVQDAAQVYRDLAATCGEDNALQAISISKSGIELCAAAWARQGAGAIGKVKAAVVDRLRQAGLLLKEAGETKVRIVKEKP